MTNTSNATISDIQQTGRIQEIPTIDLNLDGGTQLRVAVSETAIQRYQTLMETEEGRASFPPILLFEDESGNLWIADGHHRLFAAIRAGVPTIRAEIRSGTRGDAILNAARINSKNGVPFETSDYRKAVKVILTEYPNLSNRTLAEMLSCSESTVRRHRDKMPSAPGGALEYRIGKDQRMYTIKPKEKKETYHELADYELAETEQIPAETSSKITYFAAEMEADISKDEPCTKKVEEEEDIVSALLNHYEPGRLDNHEYGPKTQLRPIPRDRPDVLIGNLIAFFPKEFVPNAAREIFRMLHDRYGEKVTTPLLLELNEMYRK